MRALYVEDNHQDADLVRRVLLRAKPAIEVDVATSVSMALQQLAQRPNPYQWILLDLHLPDGDGLQILRHVREQMLPIAVVAITGTGDEQRVMQALKLGVDEYLIKLGNEWEQLPALLHDVYERLQLHGHPHQRPLHVLYVDHNNRDGSLAAHHLAAKAPHIRLTVKPTAAQQWNPPVSKNEYDVLLFDFDILDLHALESIKHIRQQLGMDIPVVIATQRGSEEIAVWALRLGAIDYVVKDDHYIQRLPSIFEFAHARAQLSGERALLHQHRQEMHKLTQQVPGVITITRYPAGSSRGMTLFSSKSLWNIFELTNEEVKDHSERFADRVHPDDLRYVNETLLKIITTLTPGICEYRLVLPTKGERWVESQVTPERDGDGSIQLYSYTFDISDRKAAEQRLIKSESDLRKLTDQVPGAITVARHNLNGAATILYASSAFPDVFEYEFEDIRNDTRPLSLLVHPDDWDRVVDVYSQTFRNMTRRTIEYRVILPKRGLRWLEWQATPERQPDGSVLLYSYAFDITERKAYAEAIYAAQASERANRAKTEFLSAMSHELRTPLNAVLGFSQLLQMNQQQPLNEEQRNQIAMIEQAGLLLLGIINDVLDLSRIEAGNLSLSTEAVSMNATCRDAMGLVAESARKTEVELEFTETPVDIHVLADPLRLKQVLVNLLSNAIKYNRAGGHVRLDIDSNGSDVTVAVSDTGKGMTAQQLSRLFEPFNRLGAERTSVEGTGIGLVIVKKLMALMHGELNVTSVAGAGSCFTIKLPVTQLPLAEAAPIPAAISSAARSRQFTVLYAEDNEVNILVVRKMLATLAGCSLRVARSGSEAIAAAQQDPPDIMLLDMHLGDMNAIDVAGLLDGDTTLRKIPRIMLSADALPETGRTAREHGFSAYLTKPVQVGELLACIERHLTEPP